MPFGDVLEAIDQLSPEDQESLGGIVSRRVAERSRKQLALEMRDAHQEFADGRCQPTTTEELMNEILDEQSSCP
jgi:hypothetical protein